MTCKVLDKQHSIQVTQIILVGHRRPVHNGFTELIPGVDAENLKREPLNFGERAVHSANP